MVSAATKEEWLSRVNTESGQSGTFGVDVSELALTVGSLGLQLSTIVSATVKWSVGHGVAVARDQGGSFVSDPTQVTVNFPIVHTDEDGPKFDNGSGVGLDVDFMMTRDRMSFGVSVQNVFNTLTTSRRTSPLRGGAAIITGGFQRGGELAHRRRSGRALVGINLWCPQQKHQGPVRERGVIRCWVRDPRRYDQSHTTINRVTVSTPSSSVEITNSVSPRAQVARIPAGPRTSPK